MDLKPIRLEGFEGREEALAGIKRYVHGVTPVMFYRTDDLIHSRRVLWHLEEALPDILSVYESKVNVDFMRTLALVHDDVEIITGDVQLHDKERMSPEEVAALQLEEANAIPNIVKKYSPIANGHDYATLLKAAKEKKGLEAQLSSFFDKFDAGGEAWHEVWAGNTYFTLPAGGNHGSEGGYVRRLNEFPDKYPLLRAFFDAFPHYLPEPHDFTRTAQQGQPHTLESLYSDSGYPLYERWKHTIITREGTELLTTQKEFF